jgi:hypothetical protein
MRIKITERQLNEVLGANLMYLDTKTDDISRGNADNDITVNDKTDIEATPTTGDDISKMRSPRGHYGARKRIGTINCSKNNEKDLISETNQELEDKTYTIPTHLLNTLKNNMNKCMGSDVKGQQRLNNLINTKNITYGEMYRLKNHFNNINKEDKEYMLLGGNEMERWVNQQLDTSMAISHNSKVLKKNLGMENAFIKKHQKTGTGTSHSQKSNNVSFDYE